MRRQPDTTKHALRSAGLAALSAFLAAVSPLSPAVADTFREALGSAYLNNPTLQSRRAELRATDENVPQALSGWRPTVQATGSAGVNRVDRNITTGAGQPAGAQNRYPRTVDLSIVQPLYRGGRTTASVERAENEVLAARANLLVAEQDILLEAGTAYMNVLRDTAVVELNINNERVIQRQLEATRDRFEVGEVTRTDVSQAEARLALAIADRRLAEGELEASRAAYERIIGNPPQNLEQPPPVLDLPESKSAAIDSAARGSHSVAAAVFQHRAAEKTVRTIEGELLPTVNVRGRAAHDRDVIARDGRQNTYALMAELNVPLYQAGAVSSRVRQAKQLASQRLVQIEGARRAAAEDAARSWEGVLTTRARIESLETSIAAQEVALEGVEQEALVGTRTVLDVLDAEQELLDARVNLVRARRDEIVASLGLAQAIGRLTADALDLGVPRYDFEAYYREVRGKWFGLGD
jgi:TolC family type I secretion outer membrane protein